MLVDDSYLKELLSLLSSRVTLKNSVKDLYYHTALFKAEGSGNSQNRSFALKFYASTSATSAQATFNALFKSDNNPPTDKSIAVGGSAGSNYQWIYYYLHYNGDSGVSVGDLAVGNSMINTQTSSDKMSWGNENTDIHGRNPLNLGKG